MTGEDHRADAVVGIAFVERGNDFLHHLAGEGVHAVGAIEGQQRDTLMLVETNLFETHLLSPWLW